ncbi:MAG: DNA recombination/repair protein RecA [Chloroflexi bacterium]|nr:DNA recombination/repair protein RecA [Chloroflexota bacterium]MCI0727408.1 DNA recombination/repair protein RecA [Chloroflexota bacterium]
MPTDKKQRLEMTVSSLQARWGVRAIRRLGQNVPSVIPHVATGFPDLDKVLGIGGIPRGRITELIGIPTSGMATLALKIAANGQASGGTAVYFDLDHTLDPDYAARCGVALERLAVARPECVRQATTLLHDLVLGNGLSILVLKIPTDLLVSGTMAQNFSTALARVMAPLARTECALLCLTALPVNSSPSLKHYPAGTNLPHYATVRLLLQRERWLYKRQDIRGYQVQVEVVKNKFGPAGKRVSIAITFNGVVREEHP